MILEMSKGARWIIAKRESASSMRLMKRPFLKKLIITIMPSNQCPSTPPAGTATTPSHYEYRVLLPIVRDLAANKVVFGHFTAGLEPESGLGLWQAPNLGPAQDSQSPSPPKPGTIHHYYPR